MSNCHSSLGPKTLDDRTVAASWREIQEKWSCWMAADMAGNFISFGPMTGGRHVVSSGFLTQPGSSVYCGNLVVI